MSGSSISSSPDSVLQKNVKLITEPISSWAKTYLSIWKALGEVTQNDLNFFTYPRQFLRSRAPWVGYVCASLLNCEWDQLQSKGMPTVHGMEWQHSSTSPRRWEDESRVWAMTKPQLCIYSWYRRDGLDLNGISEYSEYNRRHKLPHGNDFSLVLRLTSPINGRRRPMLHHLMQQ